MADYKAAKETNRERLEGNLETFERHAEDLAERRQHTERMFDCMAALATDDNDRRNIEQARNDNDTRFRDTFHEEVEIPTDNLKAELNNDADELLEESRKIASASEKADGQGVSDDLMSELRGKQIESANNFQKMAQDARDTIARSDEKINASRLRAYGMYK